MNVQDVANTTPVTAGECGLPVFLVAPSTRTPRPASPKGVAEKDLMFFMTRSYQTLIYSDGGDGST